VTVTVELPDLPSLVAETIAVPCFLPVTSPFEFTVAIDPSLLLQVTVRPVRALPLASLSVTDSCLVPPTLIDVDAGETVTDATGASITVRVADPLFPSLVAVMVVVPGAEPVTTPDEFTVATIVFDDCHVTVRPLSVLPLASVNVTVIGVVNPTNVLAGFGVTMTPFTGATVTVIAAAPLLPSLVAVIVAVPEPTPVTSPVDETDATLVLLDPHVMVRPESTFPFASLRVAVSC